jgi:hypothetical protein
VTVVGELVALLEIFTFAPVTAPALVGENVTVSVAVCPGVSIMPFETPLALNPAPVTVTPDTVMVEFPVFVRIDESWLELFTFTVPKLKLVGFADSTFVAAIAVPVKLIVNGEGVPFVDSVIDPLTGVVEVGVKTALNDTLPPAAIVVDVVRPVIDIPVPVTEMFENVSVAVPLLVSVMGCELLLPTTTFVKVALVGEAEICG